jgi:hypothetical protein
MIRSSLVILIVGMICVLLVTCSYPYRLNFDKVRFPDTPINFEQVNSEYDDYNSDLPKWLRNYPAISFTLIFSTNRNSEGDNFDFIYFDCQATSNFISENNRIQATYYGKVSYDSLNTTANELGPYIIYDSNSDYAQRRFFYATDKSGTLDIYVVNYHFSNEFKYHGKEEIIKLPEINSNYDEAYPSIYFDDIHKKEVMYYTSNRDGGFDIYTATSQPDRPIEQSINIEINKVNELCSEDNDKCPYITGNIMVFTSDRDGGYGGFDLWYSTYNGAEWTEPQNFGEKINTEYDEYRPVLQIPDERQEQDNFHNNFMIFSSNRPGGKGGFDLYYVGVDKFEAQVGLEIGD